MTSATEYLWFETPTPRAFLNITERVRAIVRRSGVREGICLVSAMHITATVYVNDDERGLIADIEAWADRLAPPGDYQHHRTGESNGDAHLKNLLLGHQVLLPVTKGDLDLGPWEQVFYGEFDGQRRKRVVVKVLGDPA
jgi:secondary thiamine-phosphate synthase enzyme